jgi:hypothetical protein
VTARLRVHVLSTIYSTLIFITSLEIIMYSNQIYPKVDRLSEKDKSDDPNRWYIEISNIPLHFNKEDIVYFVWKTLDKCRALKKTTNPVLFALSRLYDRSMWRNCDAFGCTFDRRKRPLTAWTSMASSMYLRPSFREKNLFT